MFSIGIPREIPPLPRRYLCLVAACVLLAAILSACGGDADTATGERVLGLEAKLHALEESLEAQREENAQLESKLAALRLEQTDYVQEQEAAGASRERQEEQLAALEESQALNDLRLDELEARLEHLEVVASIAESVFPAIEAWLKRSEELLSLLKEGGIQNTLRLAEAGGGQGQIISYGAAYGEARSAVLVLPDPLPEGKIPLIVSLHGFGGDSFVHSLYLPLHERVNRDGFALLLPNGTVDPDGNRFWNPSDGFGKADQDDAGALAALVQEAGEEFDIGPVYFFGHSNGGFMSYWMACQGLPGLRAVASLAGTSYMDDGSCEGAAPVSVLHIHGTKDDVVLFEGVEGESDATDKDALGYAGALDMAQRWGQRAGCHWPEDRPPYAALDFDQYVPGPETHAFRLESGCAEGISIELWKGEGSGHAPVYGDSFTDALLDWLLAQE